MATKSLLEAAIDKPAGFDYSGKMALVLDPAAPETEQVIKVPAEEFKGETGINGWTPVLAIVNDGERRVQRVADWIGGTGAKPEVGVYVGAEGFVATLAQATDIRGAEGQPGSGGLTPEQSEQLTKANTSRTNVFDIVIDGGAVGNGTSICDAAFAAAVASGKDVFIPSGTFLVSLPFTLAEGQSMYGTGYKSKIKITADTIACKMSTNSQVRDVCFLGASRTSNKLNNCGIYITDAIGWAVINCIFENFAGSPTTDGGGICAKLIKPGNSEGGRIIGCRFQLNFVGLNLQDRADYITVTACTIVKNNYGVVMESGNVTITGCVIGEGVTGIYSALGNANNGHSTISSCLINHNTAALDISNIPLGLIFVGCQIYFGTLTLTNTTGTRFVACDISSISTLTLTNNTLLQKIGVVESKAPTTVNVVSGESWRDAGKPLFQNVVTGAYYRIGGRDRVTESQRLAMASPPVGTEVYQTNATEGIYVYKSTGWVFVI